VRTRAKTFTNLLTAIDELEAGNEDGSERDAKRGSKAET
jgi:hypothetical protein